MEKSVLTKCKWLWVLLEYIYIATLICFLVCCSVQSNDHFTQHTYLFFTELQFIAIQLVLLLPLMKKPLVKKRKLFSQLSQFFPLSQNTTSQFPYDIALYAWYKHANIVCCETTILLFSCLFLFSSSVEERVWNFS